MPKQNNYNRGRKYKSRNNRNSKYNHKPKRPNFSNIAEDIRNDLKSEKKQNFNDFSSLNFAYRPPTRFIRNNGANRVTLRNLNNNTHSPTFQRYSKDEITTYLSNPYRYQRQLRDASIYLYGASSHYRRLIQYFASLSDVSFVVSPYNTDVQQLKSATIRSAYLKTLHMLDTMNLPEHVRDILTVCFREDTCYVTMWEATESVIFQQLPSNYCDISSIEDDVFNVNFNFSYFDTYSDMLDYYPDEFRTKYNAYLKDRTNSKWQELDAPTSFAIKCNRDIADYPVPPFVGILREVYEIEDYKQLKLTKSELENYAMLAMTLPMNKNGDFALPLNQATDFYRNLDSVLPEEVGSVLSPMKIDKISFERNQTGDTDNVVDAENHLYSGAGVSSLLFNNSKASSNALLLSIKSDQSLTYRIVMSISKAINRYMQNNSTYKRFKFDILDVSIYNRKEAGDAYIKACQYGIPMVSYYCSSQGLSQSAMEGMNFLENEVMNIPSTFIPLQSSATQSSSGETSEAGAPTKEVGEITDNGEVAQEGNGDD